MNLWRWFSNRSLIGSDATILAAIIVHVSEGVIFLSTSAANGSIGMAALLAVFKNQTVTAVVLLVFAFLAGIGQWLRHLHPMARLWLLVPQQALLVVTAFGALAAIIAGAYADHVIRPTTFILCDQWARLLMPVLYSVAMLARVKVR